FLQACVGVLAAVDLGSLVDSFFQSCLVNFRLGLFLSELPGLNLHEIILTLAVVNKEQGVLAYRVFHAAGHCGKFAVSALYVQTADPLAVRAVQANLDGSAGQSGNLRFKSIRANLAEVHAADGNPVSIVNGGKHHVVAAQISGSNAGVPSDGSSRHFTVGREGFQLGNTCHVRVNGFDGAVFIVFYLINMGRTVSFFNAQGFSKGLRMIGNVGCSVKLKERMVVVSADVEVIGGILKNLAHIGIRSHGIITYHA